MNRFILSIWSICAVVLLLSNIIWGSFPIGALLAVAVLFFRWNEALLWMLTLGLIWESAMPIPLGTATIPMCVAGMIMQTFSRHQLRSNNLTRGFTAAILQSVGQLAIGFVWPPRNFGNLGLQMAESSAMLLMAGLLAPAITTAIILLAQRFRFNLEGRLRQL